MVGINGGVQTGATSLTDHFEFESNVETATVDVTYPSKAAVLIDGNVVVRLWKHLGAGVAVSQATRDGAAEVDASIPHPLLFQQPRTVTGSQSGISDAQTGVHFQLSYAVAVAPRVIVTLSGGPSYVHVSQDLVTDVNYSESYPYTPPPSPARRANAPPPEPSGSMLAATSAGCLPGRSASAEWSASRARQSISRLATERSPWRPAACRPAGAFGWCFEDRDWDWGSGIRDLGFGIRGSGFGFRAPETGN